MYIQFVMSKREDIDLSDSIDVTNVTSFLFYDFIPIHNAIFSKNKLQQSLAKIPLDFFPKFLKGLEF